MTDLSLPAGLRIGCLATRCRLPRDLAALGPRIEGAARDELPRRLGRQLKSVAGVSRLRRLAVRVELSRHDLESGRLTELWAASLERALERALHRGGEGVVRLASRAAWVERLLRDLVAGTAAGRWEYEEFARELELPAAGAALQVLEAEAEAGAEVLHRLEAAGELDALLGLWDEVRLERLVRALSSESETAVGVELLVEVARRLLAGTEVIAGRLTTRRRALRLFARLWRPSATASALPTPRQIFHALLALELLLAVRSPGAARKLPAMRDLPQPVVDLLAELESAGESASELEGAIDALRRRHPEAAEAVARALDPGEEPWIESDFAGLFLLVDTVEELGWPRRLAELEAAGAGELVTPVLTLLALALAGRFSTAPEELDPGMAIWAGLGEDPDLGRLSAFCARPRELERLRHGLGVETAGSWDELFDQLAARLSARFTARIRGFRHAGRDFVRRSFLALPGRVRLHEGRLQAVIAPSPLAIALHVAGLDRPAVAPSWLGVRSFTVELEGL